MGCDMCSHRACNHPQLSTTSPVWAHLAQGIFISADRCRPNIQRGYGHRRQAGAPEETVDVDGTGAGYGLRSSVGVGYAVTGWRLHSFAIIAAGAHEVDGRHRRGLPSLRFNRVAKEEKDHVHASTT